MCLRVIVSFPKRSQCCGKADVGTETRSIPEPSGALSLAGLKAYIVRNGLVNANKRFVAVISGGNMNFGRLRFVAERAELGERREVLMAVKVPEKPGRWVFLSLRIQRQWLTISQLHQVPLPPGRQSSHRVFVPLFLPFFRSHHLFFPPPLIPFISQRPITRSSSKGSRRDPRKSQSKPDRGCRSERGRVFKVACPAFGRR